MKTPDLRETIKDSKSLKIAVQNRMLSMLTENASWEAITSMYVSTLADILVLECKPSACLTYLRKLKHFFNKYKEYIPCDDFLVILDNKLKSIKKEDIPSPIVLHEDEIRMLHNYTPANATEIYAKRLFMLMLLTGAHKNDALCFSANNISSDGKRVFYTTIKSNVDVSIHKHKLFEFYLRQDVTGEHKEHDSKGFLSDFRNMLRNAGIEEVKCERATLNTAVYTYATTCWHSGYSVVEIKQLMGLTSTKHTQELIVGFTPRRKKPENIINI